MSASKIGRVLGSILIAATLPSYAATFAPPVTVAIDGGSEPTMDVAPDGTMYITAATGLGGLSAIYRSDNGGATWKTLPASLRMATIGGGDMDLVVRSNGNLATTDLWLGSSSVATSTDKGETWLASPLQGVPAQDRQWVASTSNGVYHVTHQIPSGDVVSFSTDGLVYPIHSLAATPLDQTGCICAPGNIVARSGGLLADSVAFAFPTTTSGIGISRSTNGGLTWTVSYPGQSVNAGAVTGFPIVATDGNGRIAAVWQAATNGVVYLVTSNDFGGTWSAPKVIDNTGTSVYPWVAYRNGRIAVSYYHTTTPATDGLSDNVPESAQWTISFKSSDDNFAARTDIENIKQGPICTMGTGCSEDRELGDFQSIELTSAGKAVIAYNRDVAAGTDVRFVKEQ